MPSTRRAVFMSHYCERVAAGRRACGSILLVVRPPTGRPSSSNIGAMCSITRSVAGPGDWRQAGCVQEAQAYNRPLIGTYAKPHPGVLPRDARLLGVRQTEGPGKAVLAAVKPAGTHSASSGHGPAGDVLEQGAELTVRLYEAEGHGTDVTLESRFGLSGARSVNFPEEGPGEDLALVAGDLPSRGAAVSLEPGQLATVRLVVPRPPELKAGSLEATEPLATEPAQPVFSRYWLHNKGAAPMGNQALAVHALATALVVRSGDKGEFIAQVASGAAQGRTRESWSSSAPKAGRSTPRANCSRWPRGPSCACRSASAPHKILARGAVSCP